MKEISIQSDGNVVIISCTGFKTKEITLVNQTRINITLGDKIKSKTIKSLSKLDSRKKRRADNMAKRNSQKSKKTDDFYDWLFKSAGRTTKNSYKKKQRELINILMELLGKLVLTSKNNPSNKKYLLYYFPIQKLAKMLPNKSSFVISPVISPK